jgi:hypothetical protein
MAEINGTIKFDNVIEGVTYREESDEQTGHREKVVIETRDKTKIPQLVVEGKEHKSYNLPTGSHIVIEEGDEVKAGQVIVKIQGSLVSFVTSPVVFQELQNCLKQEIRVTLLSFLKLMVWFLWELSNVVTVRSSLKQKMVYRKNILYH